MKLCITALLSAIGGTAACTHDSRPQTAPQSSTLPTQTALVSSAQPAAQVAPGAPTIPRGPQVPPPITPTAKPADEAPLTPSSGLGSPRDTALPLMPTDPALDKPETSADEESVREIRGLLAADKSLSATARQVTVFARQGRVRLSGQVNTAKERASIERYARMAANVRDVKNELVVLER